MRLDIFLCTCSNEFAASSEHGSVDVSHVLASPFTSSSDVNGVAGN
jgi:hypothetical protein